MGPLDTDVFESLFRNFKPRETPYGSQKGIGGGTMLQVSVSERRVHPGLEYELV
ncbi:hypothetical protein B484DRAFT_411480 [Ochromonadaceae sp. CCMP2298]|nr:hypothetical protein B484DRAFT_411480 [Ochromonadaceae sp. CCMP2298]